MKRVRVTNTTRGRELGSRIGLADRWWLRLRGLLFRPPPGESEGLLLLGSRAVHMFGMRYPLDIAILDRGGRILAVYPELRPGRLTRLHASAAHSLELPPGTLEATGTRADDRLTWRLSDAAAEPHTTDRSGR